MLKFLNLEPEIFAIDINDSSLKIIKLIKKRKGFSLVSFNDVKIKQGVIKEGIIQDKEALANIIKKACNTVKGKKLGTKYAIISLPEEKSFSRLIQMPKMTAEELKLALPFEAGNYIPLAIDNAYLDFQIINSPQDNLTHLDLLINAMPKSIIDNYVSCCKNAGLIPCILEVESQAVARALLKNGENIPPVILIDLGYNSTSFIIFSNGSVRFTSSIPVSSQQLTNAISDSLGINLHEAETLKIKHGLGKKEHYNIDKAITPILNDLVIQIKKYIDFYHSHSTNEYFKSDGKIEKIILSGGGANLKNISNFLSKELKIPVELGNPLVNIILPKKNKFSDENILSFTTALGLALRGASEKLYD